MTGITRCNLRVLSRGLTGKRYRRVSVLTRSIVERINRGSICTSPVIPRRKKPDDESFRGRTGREAAGLFSRYRGLMARNGLAVERTSRIARAVATITQRKFYDAALGLPVAFHRSRTAYVCMCRYACACVRALSACQGEKRFVSPRREFTNANWPRASNVRD